MTIANLSYPDFLSGSVWLVGAGPGAPCLLTLQALHALETADIIVYDALVSQEILSLARSDAELEYAGKRGGKPSVAQRKISLRLVELARSGKRVCRLKGGDPFVFARGAEEALILSENNIPFRIVPGITAGIGGLANAYIPLTHRDINHHVTFLTGHDSTGNIPSAIDWELMGRSGGVLVFYMAMRNIRSISQKLLSSGRESTESVAFIVNATLPTEQLHITTLGSVADSGPPVADVPAIIVIGDVVRLRSSLLHESSTNE